MGFAPSSHIVLVPAGRSGNLDLIDPVTKQVTAIGGFSSRTSFGGGHGQGVTSADEGRGFLFATDRDAKLLDSGVDAARVRAMYTSPAYARRGVGRLVLSLCEAAAAAEGFTRLELVATLSGEPLYGAYGFIPLERIEVSVGAVAVPAVRMEKHVNPNLLG